jgi:hypothetical protein
MVGRILNGSARSLENRTPEPVLSLSKESVRGLLGDWQSTAMAALAAMERGKMKGLLLFLILMSLLLAGCVSTSSPDVESTVQVAIAATLTARPTETPMPTPTGACTPESSGAAAEPAETSQPPRTDLEAVLQVPTTLPDGDSVELEFTLINHSETGVYVLKWYTPLEGVAGEIFRVERDGQPIPYEGPLVMRGDPTPDAYVFLDAGASVSATVDLAAAGETGIPVYDFSEPGAYAIAFISPRISHVARTEDQMASSVNDLGPIQMPSNRVVVAIQSAAGE